MSIYLKATQGLKTIEEYILDIFSEPPNVYEPNFKKAKATYKDKDLTEIECKQARRSLEDIIDIIKTNYNNESTEQEICNTLYNLYTNHKIRGILCPDVDKIVFYFYEGIAGYVGNYKLVSGYRIRDLGLDYKGKGKYSLRDILCLAGQKDNYRMKVKKN